MRLFFREFGAGRPFVILHGLFGISDNWVTMGRKLADEYRVLIPDLRNHGQSPHSPVFDFPALEDDLLEFIETHELGPVTLLGHSLGGKTAIVSAICKGSGMLAPQLATTICVVEQLGLAMIPRWQRAASAFTSGITKGTSGAMRK